MYKKMLLLWYLIILFVLKFGSDKRVFLTKCNFYINSSTEISGKGFLHSYQQASSLMGHQTITGQRFDFIL